MAARRCAGRALFLAALSLAFWAVYLTRREQWWAIIPGGALATLALVAALDTIKLPIDTGGIFLLAWAPRSCYWRSSTLPRGA
jgi:hypothetical protein